MLFYLKYKDQKDIDKIPSSYLVLNITFKKKIPNHDNIKNLDITPDVSLVNKETDKEKYIYKLNTTYREYVVLIVNKLLDRPASNSIVIACSEKECDKYGFNVPKVICEFIEKRYEYKTYKFTNTILKDMRNSSRFSDKGLTRMIKDMAKLTKLFSKPKI